MVDFFLLILAQTHVNLWAIVLAGVFGMVPPILTHRRELKKMRTQLEKDKKEWERQLENAKNEISEKDRTLKDYELKISFFDRIMDFKHVNKIKDSVNNIFQNTSVDRFLILIAVNGSEDPNIVSVIFEQHKQSEIKYYATARYRNIKIDSPYKEMIKKIKQLPYVLFHTKESDDCLLKSFYELEGVNHSLIKFLAKKPIDDKNDFLVFSSVTTFSEETYSKNDLTFINTEYQSSIIPNILKVLNEENTLTQE